MPDASVMVEVLWRTETGTALTTRLAAARLIAPELLDVEVAAVMRRGVLRGSQTEEQARDALATLRDWPIRRISHRILTVRSAKYWQNATAYDAVYVAVAALHDATVITADGPLARAPIADVVVENISA